MAGKAGRRRPPRVNLRLSTQLIERLEELAKFGYHGTTRTEVAENFVRDEIVRLIATDFFERARRTGQAQSKQRGDRVG
jgi:hypothetical protein